MAIKQGRLKETTLGQRVLAIVLIAIILLLAKSLWRISSKYEASQEAKLEAERATAVAEARHRNLEDQVRSLHTSRGREEEIRRSLPVAKEGERVVVIIDDQATSTEATESASWLDKIFKRD